MKSINYPELRRILEQLEQLIPEPDFEHRAIRKKDLGPRIQGFGLDNSNGTKSLPIIVAIGGNYTQADEDVPRLLAASHVEDDLKICRLNLRHALKAYETDPQPWTQCDAASSHSLPITAFSDFHLVMSNFCLWITARSWQKIGTPTRAELLESNPLFDGRSTAPGDWEHLRELKSRLCAYNVLWVAHGIHSEVFPLFRQFIRGDESSKWLLLPNLAYYYDYENWNLLRGDSEASYA